MPKNTMFLVYFRLGKNHGVYSIFWPIPYQIGSKLGQNRTWGLQKVSRTATTARLHKTERFHSRFIVMRRSKGRFWGQNWQLYRHFIVFFRLSKKHLFYRVFWRIKKTLVSSTHSSNFTPKSSKNDPRLSHTATTAREKKKVHSHSYHSQTGVKFW